MSDDALSLPPGAERLLHPPQLPLSCRVRLAARAPQRCPVLVLLHGAGGDENALLPLAQAVPPGFNVVLPRAPRRMPRGGWFWYPVRFARQGPQAAPAKVEAACSQLLALLRSLDAALGFAPPRLYLAGFSQGAALCLLLALRRPGAFAGLGLFGGRLLPQAQEGARRARRLDGLPVFVAHGLQDEVLPPHHAAQTMRALLRERALPTLCLHPGRHELTPAMAADFAAWLAPRAGPLSAPPAGSPESDCG